MLTFNELAAHLAELTGCTCADAENFLRELFALAAEKIESEGEVEIPCLGRFALMEGEVVFKPDSELAAAINSPFADFEPVELPDGFSLEESTEPAEVAEPVVTIETVEDVIEQPETTESTEQPELTEQCQPSVPSAVSVPVEIPEPEKRVAIRWWWLLITAILFFVVGFLFGQRWNVAPSEESIEKDIELTDTLVAVEIPEPEPVPVSVPEPEEHRAVVLDTVSSGRFLTTMARAHYNQFEYWVYIYEANASRLGNPDRLEAGTVVVIPSADSLGLKTGDPEKINEAVIKAQEIYKRFN